MKSLEQVCFRCGQYHEVDIRLVCPGCGKSTVIGGYWPNERPIWVCLWCGTVAWDGHEELMGLIDRLEKGVFIDVLS